MGSPQDAALRHRLSSTRGLIQSLEADLLGASPLAKSDIELLIRFFKDAEQNAKDELELHELTNGGLDARKRACAHPERFISNAPPPPLAVGDRTPPRPLLSREEKIASKTAELETELRKAEARTSELKKKIEQWYLNAFPDWQAVTADARDRWTTNQQLAIEQYAALKSRYEQVLPSQVLASSEIRKTNGTTAPSLASPASPFLWSEIHAIAAEKINTLDETIRGEISASIEQPPSSGGARHRFFVLLGEKAGAWAKRAKNAYLEALEEIGRKPSQSTKTSIWRNGLHFFLEENVRQFMILACGIEKKELEWAQTGSLAVRGTPQVARVVSTLGQIDRIIQNISIGLEAEMTSTGDWKLDMQNLIDKLKLPKQSQPQFSSVARTNIVGDADSAKPDPILILEEDFRWVHIHGQRYPLSKNQGKMMKVLWDAYQVGKPWVSNKKLAAAIETPDSEPRSSWRNSPLWGTVIISERGICRLKLADTDV